MIITIDGPAGVGKSSVASFLAADFGFLLLKSGSFYRALSLYLQRTYPARLPNIAVEFQRQDAAWQELWQTVQSLQIHQDGERIFLQGEDVTPFLQTAEQDALTPRVSSVPVFRDCINKLLHRQSDAQDLVAEGRDMGTVVFPQAQYKFFLDASPAVRAQRRWQQLSEAERGQSSLADLQRLIEERDAIDRSKSVGALRAAEDACVIDTSNLTFGAVCQIITESLRGSKGKHSMTKNLKSSTATIDTEFDSSMFEQALLDTDEEKKFIRGNKVDGVVVKITDEDLFVDIKYKAEGRIPRSEFGEEVPVEGQSIKVVFNGEDKEGNIRLSYADLQRAELEAQLEPGNVVQGKVGKLITRQKEEQTVPVGFSVELAPGVEAFVPLSQIDLYPAPPESYTGSTLDFRIERIEMKGRHQNIVVNRRKLLEVELHEKQKQFFAEHQIGDVVKGKVRSFVDFGAFVDLGGFSGLLHIMNIAWHPVKKPQDQLKLGDELELRISDLDPEKKKIGLSLKAMLSNPWDHIAEKFQVDQVVKGRVVLLQNYGAFVELEPGIEGLIHVSEMSWIKQIKHPKEVLAVDDEVQIKILGLDIEQQRIRLGLRQTQPNPWVSIAERYPVGTRLTLPVKNIIKNGAFLTIEDGIDGFLHQDDLSWGKRVGINEVAKIGEQLEVEVLSCDPEERRIRLGVKQLESNPWQELKKYKKGTVIEGVVVNKTDFGVFISVTGGIEGLVHKNDLSNDRAANRDELLNNYQNGDKVRALIVEIDEKKRRLGLSVKALERSEEQQSMNQYLAKNDKDDNAFTLGDALEK